MKHFKVVPEDNKVDFTNLRHSITKGELSPVMEFEAYGKTGAHIQIKKGTVLDVVDEPIYGDVGKTKKFYRVLNLTLAGLKKITKAPQPTKLPEEALYVYGNDGELVK